MNAPRIPQFGHALDGHLDTEQKAEKQTSPKVLLVYTMWVLMLFEPDGFLAALGPHFLARTFAWSQIPVAITLAFCAKKEAFYWPYILILLIHLVWVPFAANTGLVRINFLTLLSFFLIFALTVSVLTTPRETVLLVKLALLQFLWYGLQGIPAGLVWWHGNLSNEDSFGPFMVLGFGFSCYFMTGTSHRLYRYLSAAIGLICTAGVIVCFARGAMLAFLTVLVTILIRSPRRLVFLGYGLIAVAVGLIVIQLTFPGGEYWAEMQTIEGAEEDPRAVLWGLAWQLFLTSPVLGIAPGNFGPNAVEYFTGKLGAGFDDPAVLYFWDLHNDFVKILVEQGVVGVFAMGAMLIGFNNRLRFLRTEGARRRWHESTGGFIDLRNLSLGLEVAMVAFLANSFFYNQLYMHWFWSLFALTYVLANVTRAPAKLTVHDLART